MQLAKKFISGIITFSLITASLTGISLAGKEKAIAGDTYGQTTEDNTPATPVSDAALTVQYHTQKEIREYVKRNGVSIKDKVKYAKKPVTEKPYNLGKLSKKTLNSALKMLNQVRYIAGVPNNVELSDEYTELAQAAALINGAHNYLNHYPSQPKGMSDDMYALAKKGSRTSNLGMGYKNLNSAILYGWMADPGVEGVGHRLWLLNSKLQKTGFGSAGRATAAQVWGEYGELELASGVTWPAQNMPVEYFSTSASWSVSTGYELWWNRSNIKVILTRKSDGKKWKFSEASSDGELDISLQHADNGVIIFNPKGIKKYKNGDEFNVKITGLKKTELKKNLNYTVRFFKLGKKNL